MFVWAVLIITFPLDVTKSQLIAMGGDEIVPVVDENNKVVELLPRRIVRGCTR